LTEDTPTPSRRTDTLLLAATFLIAVSGLVYELIAGAASSYLLGDSIYHFSLVIGLFMTAMGIGAWLSRYVENPERGFVIAQILLGLIGGFSAPILFAAFALIENYSAFLYLICLSVGALMGLEIPLIIRILEGRDALKVTISNVLTMDYIGALAAALLFPLVLIPHLGLMGASLLFGALNLAVAIMAAWMFRAHIGLSVWLSLVGACVAVAFGLVRSEQMLGTMERNLYANEIIHAQQSPYQRIVITQDGGRTQLFLNGSIQFDTLDEYRYHESLVHPIMTRAPRIEQVVIFGGGDGMATREVLRYPGVKQITLVDLDPAVTTLFRDDERLAALNDRALLDPRVTIVNADAWEHVKGKAGVYDVAILDLPDPKDLAISKLYSRAFYADLSKALGAGGVMVTQATSPIYARRAYWTIAATLDATADHYAENRTLQTLPYHTYVPSFGEWGFVMAGGRLSEIPLRDLPDDVTYFADGEPVGLFSFPPDMAREVLEPNTLFDHPLPRLYEEGWSRWYR
jgi:spermidine synthase